MTKTKEFLTGFTVGFFVTAGVGYLAMIMFPCDCGKAPELVWLHNVEKTRPIFNL